MKASVTTVSKLYARLHQTMGLLVWLAIVSTAGAAGAIASTQAPEFYGQLVQPTWAPPASVFGPVWSVLYVLMGVAAWLVWRLHGWRDAGPALTLFMVQLVANALWSWLFFAWHQGAWATAEVMVLGLLVVATLFSFGKKSLFAGLLLIPYLAWVMFASVLTLRLWQLNPGMLGS